MKKYKLSELFGNSFYFRSRASDGLHHTIEREAQVIDVPVSKSVFRKPIFRIIAIPFLLLFFRILYVLITNPAARDLSYRTDGIVGLFSGETKTQEEVLLDEIKNIFLEAE